MYHGEEETIISQLVQLDLHVYSCQFAMSYVRYTDFLPTEYLLLVLIQRYLLAQTGRLSLDLKQANIGAHYLEYLAPPTTFAKYDTKCTGYIHTTPV